MKLTLGLGIKHTKRNTIVLYLLVNGKFSGHDLWLILSPSPPSTHHHEAWAQLGFGVFPKNKKGKACLCWSNLSIQNTKTSKGTTYIILRWEFFSHFQPSFSPTQTALGEQNTWVGNHGKNPQKNQIKILSKYY